MKAKKKPLEAIDAASLGVDLAPSIVVEGAAAACARKAEVTVESADDLTCKLKNEAAVLCAMLLPRRRRWGSYHRHSRGPGAEGGSRVLQASSSPIATGWMSATKHAPRGPLRVIKRRHGLAEIAERGGGIPWRP